MIRPLFDPAETEVKVISFSRNLRQKVLCLGFRCDPVSRLSWNRLNAAAYLGIIQSHPGGKLEKEGGRGGISQKNKIKGGTEGLFLPAIEICVHMREGRPGATHARTRETFHSHTRASIYNEMGKQEMLAEDYF